MYNAISSRVLYALLMSLEIAGDERTDHGALSLALLWQIHVSLPRESTEGRTRRAESEG